MLELHYEILQSAYQSAQRIVRIPSDDRDRIDAAYSLCAQHWMERIGLPDDIIDRRQTFRAFPAGISAYLQEKETRRQQADDEAQRQKQGKKEVRRSWWQVLANAFLPALAGWLFSAIASPAECWHWIADAVKVIIGK